MRSAVVLLVLVLALARASAASGTRDPTWSPPPSAQIQAAFAADGYTVARWVGFQGMRGAVAFSTNVTILGSGEPKRAYYVEGTGYEMGYLLGLLAPNETALMANQYVDRFLTSLLAPSWQKKYENTTLGRDVNRIVGALLTKGAYEHFSKDSARGVFPDELVQEMKGLVDGVQAVAPSSGVTFERIVALNYGFDWISALAFSNLLPEAARVLAFELGYERSSEVVRLLEEAREAVFQVPVECDAFGVYGAATATGSTFFARDFQLPTCDVLQDINAMAIYNPSDGRNAMIGVMAPGLVGCITAFGAGGVAMGVDTLRSAAGTPSQPGLNSVLLVRHVGHTASSTADALETIASAQRGCPWLYPLCDAGGHCVIVEAAHYTNGSLTDFDPLHYVESPSLRALLPSKDFVAAHGSAALFDRGIFVRNSSFCGSDAYLQFNAPLFNRTGTPYYPSQFGAEGFVFPNWTDEKVAIKSLMNNYFPPSRCQSENKDFVLVANTALVPEMRLTMMGPMSDLIAKTSDCTQWRFDSLNAQLLARYGQIDAEAAKDIISFLAPDRTPGYWNDTINPHDPMSAQIEGAISVVDFAAQTIYTRSGYWADGWVHLTLSSYIAQQPSRRE